MSTAYNHRRKTIKRFKKQFGKTWRIHYAEHVSEILRKREGRFIGTLQDIVAPQPTGEWKWEFVSDSSYKPKPTT